MLSIPLSSCSWQDPPPPGNMISGKLGQFQATFVVINFFSVIFFFHPNFFNELWVKPGATQCYQVYIPVFFVWIAVKWRKLRLYIYMIPFHCNRWRPRGTGVWFRKSCLFCVTMSFVLFVVPCRGLWSLPKLLRKPQLSGKVIIFVNLQLPSQGIWVGTCFGQCSAGSCQVVVFMWCKVEQWGSHHVLA